MKHSVPCSWIQIRIGDTGFCVTGNTPSTKDSSNYGGGIPYIKPPQLNNKIVSVGDESLSEKGAKLARILPKNSVLISCIGNLGKTALNTVPVAFNQQINAIIPNNAILSKFLFYQAQSTEFRHQLEEKATATTISIVNKSNFEKILVNIAPLNEQKRIVAKIEELFSELDNGIAALKTAREQLKVYRQSVLKHAFEGKLTAKWREDNADKLESPEQLLARIQQEREARYQQQLEDWETKIKDGKKLSKLIKPTKIVQVKHEDLPILPIGWAWIEYSGICEKIRNGIAVKPSGEYGDKIFRISAVRAMEFNLDDIRYLQHPDGQYNDYFLSKGDLVFTRYNGTRDYVGVCAEYKGDGTHLYPDKLIQTRVAVTSIIPSYLEKAINSGGSRKFMEKRIRTTAGQSGISGSDVKQMPVPICCKGEQAIIVLHLDRLLSIIKAINEEIESALTKAATLR